MTNASDTIYCEFVNSCKKLEANYGHEMKKAELREATESQTDHSHPLQRCSECRPIITMDYLKETAETDGRKLHSDLSSNIPTTGSETLNSTLELFLSFHSDSVEVIML